MSLKKRPRLQPTINESWKHLTKLGDFRRFDPRSAKEPPDTSRIPWFPSSSKTEAETSPGCAD